METIKKTLRDSVALRWLVLVLLSGLTFSTYWFQDFFGSLKDLMNSEMGISSEEFGRIIGSTTIANIFGMIIIGGIVLDKWGIRLAGLVFGGLAALGAAISAMATMGFFGDDKGTILTFLIIGRIMFGSGLEVVCVVATRTIVKWFKGYEMALAMAINMGFGRLGSALGLAVSLDIAGGSVPPAVSFAATLIAIALIMFVIYLTLDVKLDRQQAGENSKADDDDFKFSDLITLITNKSFLYIALLCVSFYAAVFPFIQYAPDLLVNKFGFSYDLPDAGNFVVFGSSTIGTVVIYVCLFIFGLAFSMVPSKMRSHGTKLGSLIVIVALFAGFAYGLRDVLSIWLVNGPKTASLIPMGTILFTPIFGNYVDKKGKAASLMILGALLLIFAHLALSVFNSVLLGYLGLLSLGVAFSLVPAAMWPSVAKIVAESRLGTAYASMFTIQNWGLGLFFWGIGALLDAVNPAIVSKIKEVRSAFEAQGLSNSEIAENIKAMKLSGEIPPFDYTIPILVLVLCGVVSIFLAFMLRKSDKEQGYGLELPSNH
ncbi:MFS transporter [Marinilabiliaceae bacterium JC017]|nr:MFS transporter [Marinilabiliaceae bacterium JC017]